MKTLNQVIEAIENGRKSQCLDERDYLRLCDYFPSDKWGILGYKLGGCEHIPLDFTENNIINDLRKDVEFGFEKALDKRGISASFMNQVVKMWLWILDDPLQYSEDYALYGLPLLKSVAVKYNFSNPIGEDIGNESKYG